MVASQERTGQSQSHKDSSHLSDWPLSDFRPVALTCQQDVAHSQVIHTNFRA